MVVLDCSAAVEIANGTEIGNAFSALLEPEEDVMAPEFFRNEVRNTFWKYVHTNKLSRTEAVERIHDAEKTITEFDSGHSYLEEAFAAAVTYDHSFYDMVYLCMARRNAATLFTLDKKLIDVCIEAGVNCTELVDF